MADFNLSAEVALQLADKSIAQLKTSIQKAFNTSILEIDADPALSKAQKAAAKKTITIPAKLDFGKIDTDKKVIEDKIKALKIKVEFDRASVRELTSKKLNELIGSRKLTVKVGVDFSADAKKKLKELSNLKNIGDRVTRASSKAGEKISKAEQRKNKEAELKKWSFARDEIDVSEINKISGATTKATGDVGELIGRLRTLASEINASRFTSGPLPKQFFESAIEDVDKLIKLFGNGDLDKGIATLQKRFEGLNSNAFANLENSLKQLFKANADLDNQERRLRGTGKSEADIGPQIGQINQARKNLAALASSFDAADPVAFGVRIKSELSGVNETINRFVNTATSDVNKFVDLLNTLSATRERIRATGGGQQALDIAEAQIELAKKFRDEGKSIRNLKADNQFQVNSGTLKNLGYVDITLSRINNTFSALRRKTSGDLSTTIGGVALDLKTQTDKIVSDALTKIRALPSDGSKGEKAQDIRNTAFEQVNSLIGRTEKLNQKLVAVNAIRESFNANGFEQSAKSVERLTQEIIQAAQAGQSLDQISRSIDAGLAKINVGKSIEGQVNNKIRQLERLRITLGRGEDGDITNVQGQIQAYEANLKARLSDTKNPLGADELDKLSTKAVFDVRQGEKINRYVENTAHKLRLLGDAQDDLAIEAKYDKWATSFEKAATKIAGGTGSTIDKMNRLKKLSDETFVKARFDADGGFFGTVSKAAGLAAKRLGAFLILAQGLYAIQAQISQSISDAVKIDKEFVRLEQVITGGLSGPKLDRAYKDLEAIKTQVLSLGRSLGIATTEIADSAQVLAQAGLQGKNLAKILDVVAKSQLGPSFASANETSEAAIAIMNQFNLTADQTAIALGGVNRLSAKYAVEAQGITEAVRRAGGVFATAGSNISEFSAAFTIIKEQTREADQSIATALRNITQRIQRSSVQKYLRETLNIDLVEDGAFIGFEKAITKIGKAIKDAGISENSPLFSEIREKLAGTLQAGRITPLLQNYEKLIEYNKEFSAGSKSIDEDVVKAFNSIENKIQRAKSALVELFTELASNQLVKLLIESFTQLTVVITTMLRALNSVPGALIAIGAAFKAVGPFKSSIQAIVSQVTPRALNLVKKNDGGKIPGRGPNKDSVLSYLTKGEYVIQRPAVDKYGVDFLDKVNKGALPRNKGGVIPSFNTGGISNGIGSNFIFNIIRAIKDGFSFVSSKVFKGKENSPVVQDYLIDKKTLIDAFDLSKKDFAKKINDPSLDRSVRTRAIIQAVPEMESHRSKMQSYGVSVDNTQPRSQRAKSVQRQYQVLLQSGASEDDLKNFGRKASNLKPNSVPNAQITSSGIPSKSVASKAIKTTTSSFKGLDLSLLTSKKALFGFGAVVLGLQATLTGVNAELGNLLAVIIGAAISFSSLAKSASILKSVKGGAESVFGFGKGGAISGVKSGRLDASTLGRNKVAKYAKTLGLADRINFIGGRSSRLANAKALQSITAGSLSVNPNAAKTTASTIKAIRSGGAAGGAKLGSLVGLKNVSSMGKVSLGLAKNLNVMAIAVGVVTAAIGYFGDSLSKTGDEALETAKNQEEAGNAARSSRTGKLLSSGAGIAGTIGGGAAAGAALGSFIPVIGTAAGAIIGGITGAIIAFAPKLKNGLYAKFSTQIDFISNLFQGVIVEPITKLYEKVSDFVYAEIYGLKALEADKASAALTGRQNFTKNRLQKQASVGNIGGNGLNDAELGDILSAVSVSEGILKGVNRDTDKIDPAVLDEQKANLQRVSEIYTALPESERAKILDAAKRSGIDMQTMFNEMGVSLLDAKVRATSAFEQLSSFLAGLEQTVKFSSAKLSGIEAGFASIINPDEKSFVPDQLFDIIGAGFDPSKLGLNQFSGAIQNLNKQVAQFDPNLAKAVNLQTTGQSAVRNLQGAVSSGAIQGLKFDNKGNKEETLASTLSDSFDIASGGNADLNSMFDIFIESKIDQMGDGFKDNNILPTKINEWLDEFASGLDKGALEQVKRINDINKTFASNYESLLKDRFAKEAEIIDLFKSSADKQKSIFDIQNKAAGLTGSKLSASEGSQAADIDRRKLQATLLNTGVGPNATPQQLQAAIIQSQARKQNAGAIVRARGIKGEDAVIAETEIRAAENERLNRLNQAAKYGADGGEVAAFAMQQFEKAAQKAAASTKFLTDSLLGTDDQIIETYKGIAAFQAVSSAKSPQEAQALVLGMSEERRGALNSYIGQNEEARSTFENKLGFSPSIAGGPEAKAVEDSLKKQQEYISVSINGIGKALEPVITASDELKKFYQQEFQNNMAAVNAANQASQRLVGEISKLPSVITHEVTVNLIGGGQLTTLQEGIRGYVEKQISVALAANNQGLQENNQGLNIPRIVGNILVPGAGELLK